jgi:molecular chaperone DnaJ
MNLKEAYSILELAEGTSPEEAKKKYRELTKKHHPDVNKDPGAEDKFKKINEAYQCVQNGKGNDREPPPSYGSGFNPFRQGTQNIVLENIEVNLTISFKESILGCKKDIVYTRQSKCLPCEGSGHIRLNNGCQKCGGKGRITIQQRGSIFISTCPSCGGRNGTENCKACSGSGSIHADASVNVSIPGGIFNGQILRLQGMGNFAGTFMGLSDQYTDTYCHINVTPEAGLSLEGQDVVVSISISLLDALRGCQRSIKTIDGNQSIDIKPQSRNREEVIIPHKGVGGVGNQRVILDVQYPTNVDKLVNILINEAV